MDYRASVTKLHDLIHMQLDVRFDWSKKYLLGTSTLTIKAHALPQKNIWLNARGMQINYVKQINGKDTLPVKYDYANDSLHVFLERAYTKDEPITLYIDYIAKPDELSNIGGSRAITSDKGLYFINPDGKEKNKPMQIWTQGETQASSVWFPTIDAPNQKMTQEIKITVDNKFKTVSNGILANSAINVDGTRTDTWKHNLPHSPYLCMMAIGNFAIVKDTWKGKEVSYYVEPEYEKVARRIFGNTPEMMTFFSSKLGVEYPWDKYSQIVVRDYVSGAMENTSATIHGEFLQRDERELLDGDYQEFISHELFHQWFGDYVTCESWSNTTLNEGFATYGEYLWNEYKFGKEEADIYHQNDLNSYLRESKTKNENLIRFHYDAPEDMFDKHSYEKGGLVIHMLRKYLGDEIFFASLKHYLTANQYKNVEVHQLRLAFEEVSGQDLNWFFNQWYLAKGHPILNIDYNYDAALKIQRVTIRQEQNLQEFPLYQLPIEIDFYSNNTIQRKKIILNQVEQTFSFPAETKPELVNVDAEKMLLAVRKDNHTPQEWVTLYQKGSLFQDRFDALQALSNDYKAGSSEAEIIRLALNDKNWKIREYAINNIETLAKSEDKAILKKTLMTLGINDSKSDVRDAAMTALDEYYNDDELIIYFKNAIHDSAYSVVETAILALAKRDKDGTLLIASQLEGDNHSRIRRILSGLYSKSGSDAQSVYMKKSLLSSTGFSSYSHMQNYGKFLKNCNIHNNINDGLETIYSFSKENEEWITRLAGVQALVDIINHCNSQAKLAVKAADTTTETEWINHIKIASKYLDDLKKE
ncbi:MAG: M1 family metallopeptidase [Bacteroidetes bacterium]|nr:M1 family metallopeptidase [Bacteroidota bacterium]